MNSSQIELEVSKNKTEVVTKKPVTYFAYPYGFYNDYFLKFTKKYYKKAFIVGFDNNM